jgi:hypothetical protein
MVTSSSPRRRERPAFFEGQLLGAGDLQDLEAYGSDLRWLHNRSLHQPGIGSGFPVIGEKGDREVVVGPGYALDADGKELVLTSEVRLPIPAVAAERDGTSVRFDLTIAYADEADLKEAETRDGICYPRGAVRLLEAPEFCWVRLERDESGGFSVANPTRRVEILEGHRIRLARIEVLNCELRSPVALEQRREARPPRLPYLVAGLTSPEPDGSPAWTPVGSDADGNLHLPIAAPSHFLFAFTRVVNTCGAGFESTPWYTAHVIGPRIVGNPTPGQGQEGQFLIVDQVHIQQAERDRFTAFLVVAVVPLGEFHPVPLLAMVGGPAGAGATPAATNKDCGQLDPDSVSSTAEVVKWIQCSWQLSWLGVEQ